MFNDHPRRRWVRFVIVSAALTGLTACTGDSATPSIAPVEYAPGDLTTTGAIGLKLPDGYTVVGDEGYKYGWPWAAIKHDDNGEVKGLIVMNGNYDTVGGVEKILWGLQSWHESSSETYDKGQINELDKDNADNAVMQDYSYASESGRQNFGTYVALCSNEHQSCAVARTTFVSEPDNHAHEQIVNSIRFTPENAANQPPLAELMDQ